MAHDNIYDEIMRVVYNFDLKVVSYTDVKELLDRLEHIRVDLCTYFFFVCSVVNICRTKNTNSLLCGFQCHVTNTRK